MLDVDKRSTVPKFDDLMKIADEDSAVFPKLKSGEDVS